MAMSTDGIFSQEVVHTASLLDEHQDLRFRRLKKESGFKGWPEHTSGTCIGESCSCKTLEDKQLTCHVPSFVKIPSKMILDLMLDGLSLPKATYDSHVDDRGRVSVVVTFYTSTCLPRNLIRPVKMGGVETIDADMAQESAAKEAIRFLESYENIEVEYLHFSELKYIQGMQNTLLKRLQSAEEDKDSLQRGLCLAARRMVVFSDQIYSIARNCFTLGETPTEESIRSLVQLFEGVAFDLGHALKRLKKNLKLLQELQPA